MLLSRLAYYVSSIPTLIRGIKNPLGLALASLRSPRPVIVELRNGTRFAVRSPMDIWIIKETCLDKDYERASMAIEDGWTVMDIGAGLGDFAVSVATAHPACKVIGYEPFPESFALLQQNVKLNEVTNVAAFPIAISGDGGPLTLQLMGAAVQHTTAWGDGWDTKQVEVHSITLDEALRDLPSCDYLKVDCEGAEFDIFFNASPATLCKIRHVCLEYHDGVTRYSHHDLTRFFEARGFVVTTQDNPVHTHLGLMYARNTQSYLRATPNRHEPTWPGGSS